MIILVNLFLFLFIKNSISEINICENKSDGFYPNLNCQSFSSCLNQTLNKTFQCPNQSELIFSPYRQRCIEKNLLYNECYLINIKENHLNCAWFSIELSTEPNKTSHHSCLYPHLFDLQTKTCKHYSQVDCKERFEPKDACDYHHPQRRNSINERPCWLTPSCRNKTNGFHGNRLQDCSSYYECKDERFIRSTLCPKRQTFSDKLKACVSKLNNCENMIVY